MDERLIVHVFQHSYTSSTAVRLITKRSDSLKQKKEKTNEKERKKTKKTPGCLLTGVLKFNLVLLLVSNSSFYSIIHAVL